MSDTTKPETPDLHEPGTPVTPPDENMRGIDRIVAIMAILRSPKLGCPWDLEQTFATIAPHTIEEAYEVADAIQRGDLIDLREELGDLLLQVVYHAQMAAEAGVFDFEDVAADIARKMVRRHPHVFGDETGQTAALVKGLWERIKAEEKAEKARLRAAQAGPSAHEPEASTSVLDDVPTGFPALMRAQKLQKKAARIGFDWPAAEPIFEKFEEELDELREALHAGDPAAIEDEMGDMLFTLVNMARHLNVDADAAARRANVKFEQRFREMEAHIRANGKNLARMNLDALEAEWQVAKARLKAKVD